MVIMKFFCDRNFSGERNFVYLEKRLNFKLFSDWLEIWYLGYIRYSEHDGDNEIFLWTKFRPSEKKLANFQLSPIGLKLSILGISGVLKMMVMMIFYWKLNLDHPKKNGRIFNFVRLALNFVSLGISGMFKMMVVIKTFSLIESWLQTGRHLLLLAIAKNSKY